MVDFKSITRYIKLTILLYKVSLQTREVCNFQKPVIEITIKILKFHKYKNKLNTWVFLYCCYKNVVESRVDRIENQ